MGQNGLNKSRQKQGHVQQKPAKHICWSFFTNEMPIRLLDSEIYLEILFKTLKCENSFPLYIPRNIFVDSIDRAFHLIWS